MTSDEHAQVLLTARLLRAAAALQWLTVAFTILAAVELLRGRALPASTTALVVGVSGLYFAVRVAFDARLFDDLASGRLGTEDLDRALEAFGRKTAGRTWNDRCRGARRLATKLAIVIIAQAASIVWIGWS